MLFMPLNNMKKIKTTIIYISLFMLMSTNVRAQITRNKFEMSTELPSPFGVYEEIQLPPVAIAEENQCNSGEFYVDSTSGHIHYCRDASGDDLGNWNDNYFISLWRYDYTEIEDDNERVYLGDTGWIAGIGAEPPPNPPDADIFSINDSFRLTIGDGTFPSGILSQGSYTGTQAPTFAAGSRFVWHPERAVIRIGTITDTVAPNPSYWATFYLDPYSTISGGNNNLGDGIGSTIAGGENNVTGGASNPTHITISGGKDNNASGNYATVGGGSTNKANNHQATVAGGLNNTVYSPSGFIGGGEENVSGKSDDPINITHTTVVGGNENNATGLFSTVTGGQSNSASGSNATIEGGFESTASGDYSTIGGGSSHQATKGYSTISGGRLNQTTGDKSTVRGGYNNTAAGNHATIGGGGGDETVLPAHSDHQEATGDYATIAGGKSNSASGTSSFIGGGNNQTASGANSVILGGEGNTANGNKSAIFGGASNTTSELLSTITGGETNNVAGTASFAMGKNVTITSEGDYSFAFCSSGCSVSDSNRFVLADSRLVVGKESSDEEYQAQFHNASTNYSVISTSTSTALGTNTAALWFVSDFDGTPNTAAIGQFGDGGLTLSGTGNKKDMNIDATSGKIGIGDDIVPPTGNPEYNVDVDGSVQSTDPLYLYEATSLNEHYPIETAWSETDSSWFLSRSPISSDCNGVVCELPECYCSAGSCVICPDDTSCNEDQTACVSDGKNLGEECNHIDDDLTNNCAEGTFCYTDKDGDKYADGGTDYDNYSTGVVDSSSEVGTCHSTAAKGEEHSNCDLVGCSNVHPGDTFPDKIECSATNPGPNYDERFLFKTSSIATTSCEYDKIWDWNCDGMEEKWNGCFHKVKSITPYSWCETCSTAGQCISIPAHEIQCVTQLYDENNPADPTGQCQGPKAYVFEYEAAECGASCKSGFFAYWVHQKNGDNCTFKEGADLIYPQDHSCSNPVDASGTPYNPIETADTFGKRFTYGIVDIQAIKGGTGPRAGTEICSSDNNSCGISQYAQHLMGMSYSTHTCRCR